MWTSMWILFGAIVAGGLMGAVRHRTLLQRRNRRITPPESRVLASRLTPEGDLQPGHLYWASQPVDTLPSTLLPPHEVVYLVLWFQELERSRDKAVRRTLPNQGWLTLPLPVAAGRLCEARRLSTSPPRWVLGAPELPLPQMHILTEIAPNCWVLDEIAQYSVQTEPLQCMLEWGAERGIWLPAPLLPPAIDVDESPDGGISTE